MLRRFQKRHSTKAKPSGRCGFDDCATELVDQIFSYLSWPHDLHALTLVSRGCNRDATPLLYNTILIAYKPYPQAISAMLERLEKDEARRAIVTTVIFDESVKSFWPNLPDNGRISRSQSRDLAEARHEYNPKFPITDPALRMIQIQLARVLPSLPNLKNVMMRHPHPYFLSPTVSVRSLLPTYNMRHTIMRPFREYQRKRTIRYFDVNVLPPINVWTSLLLLPSPLDRLSVTVLSKTSAFSDFTVMTQIRVLHLHGPTFSDVMGVSLWNRTLQGLNTLEVLCVTNIVQPLVYSLSNLLYNCKFHGLRSLEFYQVHVMDWENDSFCDFLRRHRETLQVLALSCTSSQSNVYRFFKRDIEFPTLHTLRIDNIECLPCFGCVYEPWSFKNKYHRFSASLDSSISESLAEFVRNHTGITDLAISGLDLTAASEIAQECSSRSMRRILLGATLFENMRKDVPPYRSVPVQEWRYRADSWVFYEMMFKGLELETMGYRPRLWKAGRLARHCRH